jgi:oxygen-dependent protoporphyrinogen oxidase
MPGPGQDLYSTLWSLFTEPVYKGLLMGAAFEYSRPPRPETLDDESVGSFLNRRLGSPDPGNNIVSAVLHGIYAGDIYQLSMKSLAPKFWYNEAVYGGLSKAIFQSMSSRTNSMLQKDVVLQQEIAPKLKGPLMNAMGPASVYTFREGIGALSAALEESLRANPNVELRLNQKVSKIEHDGESDGIKVCSS